jgi:predicted permease
MLQDLRYAIRVLTKKPGFAAVAILSLALGIGANTAIFSLLNSIRLSTLPVTKPEELVILTDPADSGLDIGWDTGDRELMTYPEFLQMREQATSFASLMASQSSLSRVQARVNGGEPEDLQTRLVSAEYFATLGVPAALGRTFGPGEAQTEGSAPLAVISHDFWQRRFGGRADAVGSTLTLYGTVFSIIGVTPPSFFGETVGQRPDAWMPLVMQASVAPGRDWLRDRPGTLDKVMWLHVFGRLKPGVPIEKAGAEVNTVFQQGLAAFYGSRSLPPEEQRNFLNQRLNVRPAATGASRVRGQFSGPLVMMLAAAAMVLLIACANLGNLLLARATARNREVSVKLALGVTRARLIRGFVVESLVLAVLGGAVGLAAASLMRTGLLLLVPDTIQLPRSTEWSELGFAFLLTLVVGIVLGLLPAMRTANTDFLAGLKEQGRGVAGSPLWQRVSKFVVVGQFALSLPLLVAAGLLLQTLSNLERIDLGYAKERLITVRVNVETAGYEPARRLPLFERLLERVRAVPGVRGASYARNGLFSGSSSGGEVVVEGYTPRGKNDSGASWDAVGPGYFSTLGVPVVLGREINEQDRATSPRVCVINEAFSKLFFANRNPLGMRIGQQNPCQVVGVVKDIRSQALRGDIEHQYYMPATQAESIPRDLRFAVRTAGEPATVMSDVRRALLQVDPNLPVTAQVFTDVVNAGMVQDRLLARLSFAFGIVGLVLAALGLYGVLSFGVSRRTNEIGIRKALGAQHRDVIVMILRETFILVVIGLAVGLTVAALSLRFIRSRLYGLEAADPATFVFAVGILVAVSLFAAWLPSYRASRVDPLIALRRD